MSEVFFSVSTIIGYEYLGSDSSSVYVIYNIVMFGIAVAFFIVDSVKNNLIFNKSSIIVLCIPAITTLIFLLEKLMNSIDEIGMTRYFYFILWPFSSMLMGIYISKKNRYKDLLRSLDLIIIIFTISSIKILQLVYMTGTRVSIGGATYQYAGYIISLALGLNLYFMIYGETISRYSFTKTKLYKYISIIMLLIQFITVLLTGARGPMILSIIYVLLAIQNSLKVKKRFFKFIWGTVCMLIIFSFVWPSLIEMPRFQNSIARIFSYISVDGIDLSQTSGRDIIYGRAIEKILQSPLVGYGLFGAYTVFGGYAHNIIFDILLQGGICFLGIPITFFIIILRKLYKIIKWNYEYVFLIFLAMQPIIMLLFSGTYLNNSLFWFLISFILSCDFKDTKLESKSEQSYLSKSSSII